MNLKQTTKSDGQSGFGRLAASALSFLLLATPVGAAGIQSLQGNRPAAVAGLQPMSRLAATTRLNLAISLPLRNREALTNLLAELYDPASTNFHQFLTPEQFAAQFGPTEADYQKLVDFARTNGLVVTGTHPNRALLDVNGSLKDIERVFHVSMGVYQHPKEARTFYAPDVEPSIDLDIPVSDVSGLDNFNMPKPHVHGRQVSMSKTSLSSPNGGSGPSGEYRGYDFRQAYAPGTTLTGAGQTVALYELEGYLSSDITTYETQAGLPNVTVQNVPVDSFSFVPNNSDTNGVLEVCLDIEVAIAMSPGLSKVMVYGATNGFNFDKDILTQIATDNAARQISSSWGINVTSAIDAIFQQFAAQGQSFFMAVGDSDAFSGSIGFGSDDPYLTQVGGTVLSTDGNTNWTSEVVWNYNNSGQTPTNTGSSGGISTTYSIPTWQKNVSMASNQGSTTKRNVPDVAMIADNVYTVARGGGGYYTYGTSIAAPLWASFLALANQQAALNGKPAIGFVNPILYSLAQGPNGSSYFHDVTFGNNTNTASPNKYFAVPGYDLCTGWGSPGGANLIGALSSYGGAVWVAFGVPGPGNGNYETPYNTLTLGVNNVPAGGTVAIKGPGSTAETFPLINKHMNIVAAGGVVTIGH